MIDVCHCFRFIIFVLSVLIVTGSDGFAAPPPRMRPYTGIGLVMFLQPGASSEQDLQLPLYEEPGLTRVGVLNSSRLSGNEWIFEMLTDAPPLVVSARKGDWLRVYYDDAGREAWLEPRSQGRFLSWEQFLKSYTARMLPGLQPQLYQLLRQPGGKPIATLTPKQMFKVLRLENYWGMVLTEQSQIGWVRWCDDDGRLTMGIGKK